MTNLTHDPDELLNLDPDWVEAEAYPETEDGGWLWGLLGLVFS